MKYNELKEKLGTTWIVSSTGGNFGFEQYIDKAQGVRKYLPHVYYVEEILNSTVYTDAFLTKEAAIEYAKKEQMKEFERKIERLSSLLKRSSKFSLRNLLPSVRELLKEVNNILEAMKNYDLESFTPNSRTVQFIEERLYKDITEILPEGTYVYIAENYSKFEITKVQLSKPKWGSGQIEYRNCTVDDRIIYLEDNTLCTYRYGDHVFKTEKEALNFMSEWAKDEIEKLQKWVKL